MSNKKQPARSFRRKTCVIATEIAISLMAAPLAFAQSAEKVEKLEITGTRVPSPNVESVSPIAVISADDIKLEGVRNVENLLNNLPQVFADQGGNVSNGASGTATVNLRNLGADRTLVLVNGRRLPAGSPRGPYASDLNQIPAALIRRVEVLTGGASAVYGSDAVAGVVNFIMNDKFQGVQGEVNYSFYNHKQDNAQGVADIVAGRAATNPSQFKVPGDISSDGEESDYNVTLGSNFADGRGNATIFLGYKKTRAVLQSERDYSSCALGSNAAGFTCGGSSTSYPGRFIANATGRSYTVADAAGNVRNFSTATDLYNYGPLNYYQRPSERYTAAAFAHYDINPSVRVYTELSLHDDQTTAQIAPSGLFGLVTDVHFENPLLSQSWRNTLGLVNPGDTASMSILRRNVEGGGRQDTIGHTSYRGVVGIKGDFAKHWNYDAYFMRGRVNYSEAYLNDFSITRSARAMDVVRDANGNAVCRSVVDGSDPNCVPYDIWRLGGVNPDALAYLQTPGLQKGYTEQKVQSITFSSDLGNYGVQVPGAKSGVGVAFGAERRVEKLELITDAAFTSGDLFGQGGPTIGLGGQYTVNDLFMEARVPLIEGKEFMDRLAINGSYRYSDYSTGQSSDSYGLGIEWAPMKSLMLRGSYQQAVRAANIIELFQAQGLGLYDMDSDPCAGVAPQRSLADCARTGVTASQYGRIVDSAAGQYNALFGGNPDLKPETGKTSTLGLVLTPMKDFNVSFDYFQMKVEDVISTLPSPTVLQLCLDNGQFCNLIQRDALGTLWLTPQARIIATNQNLSKWKTSGFDISADYNTKLQQGYGSLNINFIGTYLSEFKQEPIPGLGEYDCAGLYGSGVCGTPLPEWRHKLRATWTTPWNFDLALTWRYIDEVKFERTSSNPLLSGPYNSVDEKLKAQNYIDLAGSWNINKNLTLRGGINNLFDESPPLSSQVGAGFGNGNTYPQVYDALGRRIFASLTAKF
jgi:outer membrane receptor protein involved in Fe transport